MALETDRSRRTQGKHALTCGGAVPWRPTRAKPLSLLPGAFDGGLRLTYHLLTCNLISYITPCGGNLPPRWFRTAVSALASFPLYVHAGRPFRFARHVLNSMGSNVSRLIHIAKPPGSSTCTKTGVATCPVSLLVSSCTPPHLPPHHQLLHPPPILSSFPMVYRTPFRTAVPPTLATHGIIPFQRHSTA
jgi:hypothetical protein